MYFRNGSKLLPPTWISPKMQMTMNTPYIPNSTPAMAYGKGGRDPLKLISVLTLRTHAYPDTTAP